MPIHTTLKQRSLPSPAVRRALRVAAGLTQADLAAELGVSRAAVARWESGTRVPRGDYRITYAALLRELSRAVHAW